MSRTAEQLTAAKELSSAAPEYRVIADTWGWPMVVGRYGSLEALGSGQLAAFTEARQIRVRLLAIPGVTRHQVGDTETRVLLAPSAVPAVAKLLRCRKRRGAPANAFKARPGCAPSPVEARKATPGIATGISA